MTFNAQQLNQHCACITLDRETLSANLSRQLQAVDQDLLASPVWSQMFANSAVFVPSEVVAQMQDVVTALEGAVGLPGYQQAVMSWAPTSAVIDPGPIGVFMGYDFHLTEGAPQLIEINSNAGGAFLNAKLAHAQCCSGASDSRLLNNFGRAVVSMFQREWQAQGRSAALARIAIVDDSPHEQYLYPEFLLAQSLLREHGIDAIICGPGQLAYNGKEGGKLTYEGLNVDLVYNRLVDFALDEPDHRVLRQAWLDGAAVITPNPRTHALYADKRNLMVLSGSDRLLEWGLAQAQVDALQQVIPHVELVTSQNADDLWQRRKQLFFKPVAGHGSKGVYRGSKLTKRVFTEIVCSNYIAQAFVPPSERVVMVDGERQQLKVDVRLYTYRGEVLLTAARLYRGQTTNFRTAGGGFAPLFTLPSAS